MPGAFCLTILCAGQIINAATGPSGLMVLMSGHTLTNLFNNAFTFLMNLVLNFILIPKYGIAGAAIATSFSIVFVNIIRIIEVYYLIRIQPYGWSFFKPIFAGCIALGIAIFVYKNILTSKSFLSLTSVFFIYLISYATFLILLRLDENDLSILKKVKIRLRATL